MCPVALLCKRSPSPTRAGMLAQQRMPRRLTAGPRGVPVAGGWMPWAAGHRLHPPSSNFGVTGASATSVSLSSPVMVPARGLSGLLNPLPGRGLPGLLNPLPVRGLSGLLKRQESRMDTDFPPLLSVSIGVHLWFACSFCNFCVFLRLAKCALFQRTPPQADHRGRSVALLCKRSPSPTRAGMLAQQRMPRRLTAGPRGVPVAGGWMPWAAGHRLHPPSSNFGVTGASATSVSLSSPVMVPARGLSGLLNPLPGRGLPGLLNPLPVRGLSGLLKRQESRMDTDFPPLLSVSIGVHLWFACSFCNFCVFLRLAKERPLQGRIGGGSHRTPQGCGTPG